MDIMNYNLHELAAQGDFETLNTFLTQAEKSKKYGFLHDEDEKGQIPLQYAIENHHFDVIRLLLQHGTDANWQPDQFSGSLLYFAIYEHECKQNDEIAAEIVQCLLEYGTDPTHCARGGKIPLYRAIRNGNFQTAYCLLNHPKVKTNVNDAPASLRDKQIAFANKHGKTPLNLLLVNFTKPPERGFYTLWKGIKQCLYAVLLSGVDIKGILTTLGFSDEEEDAIHAFVTNAENSIVKMKKEFGFFGEEVVHQCIFSSEQEREIFKKEKFWVRWAAFQRNKEIISDKVSRKGKQFPAELAILVCKNLSPKSIHFFQLNTHKISCCTEQTPDVGRLSF